jgi:hypothetical protein
MYVNLARGRNVNKSNTLWSNDLQRPPNPVLFDCTTSNQICANLDRYSCTIWR